LAIELESVGFAAGLEGEEGKIRTVLDDRIQSFVEQIDVDFLEGLVFVAMASVGCSE
jgi:putative aminopeptidase FrvX